MKKENNKVRAQNCRIRLYDGYRGEPVFEMPKEHENDFYNATIDKQVRVPIQNREEILKELELN